MIEYKKMYIVFLNYRWSFIKNNINTFNNKNQGIIGGESYVRYIS
ncbi:adenylosuccinate lyase [Clostridium botulinum]|nr:hypothetical protein CLB_1347 [Clostridium botulinum A str. ATCC 19397]ABS38108.1 hypothetical protein CLC_1357 [Clostridium botulinum A str. Hall]AUM87454.1 adenylosuccinate lyase [Clostridium botulinum]EDT80931.1 hypothetical protein CBN_1474 [Clostridium botulinum NCTC 2916]KEI75487.1 adenylosuccinate lyase [Clostridium botulinum B2 128]KEI89207.1 adenylosuccinate lyase [Clostridium botulinum B2 433]KEI91645.1 adenylosuccinate lyase [Clostridium botulinum B2 275]KEI97551.1 adenylosucci